MATAPLRTPMERAPLPDLGTGRIPKERYTSREFAELEWEKMWTRVWLMAGRESDIPEPGDYFTYEVGRESILVIRQPDGGIGAHYNVCMHRGNRLREPGRGHAELFSCLFHGWKYGIDGKLIEALDPECFPQGVPTPELDLKPVRVDSWAGFVFVNLDPNAEPLLDYLGVIPEHMAPYHFEEWKVNFDTTIEIECNWKTCVDAFNEAYHLSATHTWTIAFSDDVNTKYDCYDKHSRMIFPEIQPSPRHESGGKQVTPEMKEMFLARVGVDIEKFQGGVPEARTAYAEAVRKMGPTLGCDFSEMNESQMCDDFHYTIFPNVTFNTHSISTWVFTHRPHPDDPNKMYFDFIELMRAPAQDIQRPDKQFFSTANGDTLAGVCGGGDLLDEDLYNLPRIQKGMRSAAFQGLHLGSQEIRIRHHQDTLMKYLGS